MTKLYCNAEKRETFVGKRTKFDYSQSTFSEEANQFLEISLTFKIIMQSFIIGIVFLELCENVNVQTLFLPMKKQHVSASPIGILYVLINEIFVCPENQFDHLPESPKGTKYTISLLI